MGQHITVSLGLLASNHCSLRMLEEPNVLLSRCTELPQYRTSPVMVLVLALTLTRMLLKKQLYRSISMNPILSRTTKNTLGTRKWVQGEVRKNFHKIYIDCSVVLPESSKPPATRHTGEYGPVYWC